MLNDAFYIFKTDEEWIILKDHTFSFKEIGKKGITKCNYQAVNITKYNQGNQLQQLFIEIPFLHKVFFFSAHQYTGLQQLDDTLQALKIKNQQRIHSLFE